MEKIKENRFERSGSFFVAVFFGGGVREGQVSDGKRGNEAGECGNEAGKCFSRGSIHLSAHLKAEKSERFGNENCNSKKMEG
ncbi:MAG TPA: hypothetical protein DEG74_05170 [Clostridiales bacterium]|nr:hypothetical protein [Clostridiales bacterium]